MARILMATDGSELATGAAHAAWALLGSGAGNSWTVLGVVEAQPAVTAMAPVAGLGPTVVDPSTAAAVEEVAEDAARQAVAALAAELGGAEERLVLGSAGRAICEVAAEGFDLVVVGSHGHGVVRQVLTGSVSRHVVEHAPCPVLVVRRPDLDEG